MGRAGRSARTGLLKRLGRRCRRGLRRRGAADAAAVASPGLQPLEPRLLLSAITVDALNDDVAADGVVSLREAIEAANTNAVVNEADASGSAGPDEITFDASLAGGTISLGSALPTITEALTIDGDAADGLTIDAGDAARLFNVDDGNGAAISVSIANLTLANGATTGDGGAVRNVEDLTLFAVEVSGGSADGSGGGVYNGGTLTARDAAIADGAAGADGGGVFNAAGGTLELLNTTVSGNTADGSGGGVANPDASGAVTIANSTITNNRADVAGGGGDGGGVFTAGDDDLLMHSTIVAGNFRGAADGDASDDPIDDAVGGFDPTSSFNLLGVNDPVAGATGLGLPAAGNIMGAAGAPIDPGLGPLADNGGSTPTHALDPASIAIDAGDNPMLLGADQRGIGFARTRGFETDIGAYEAMPDTQSLTVTFDFGFDDPAFGGNDFFNEAQRRDRLRDAADAIVRRFNDDLEAILPGGGNTWSAVLTNPASGTQAEVDNLNIAANEIYVFAGGRDIGSLGLGGAGGFSSSGTSDWLEAVATRGEFDRDLPDDQVLDFGPWGGGITFDSAGTTWHFGESTDTLDAGENDFLSVAQHEMTHLLGFSKFTDSFANQTDTNAGTFTGPAAVAEYDGAGDPPLGGEDGTDFSHWQEGLTDEGQETALDPNLTVGERKLLTPLDFAALDDVGWELQAADTTAPTLATDFDGLVFDENNPLTIGLDVDDDAEVVDVDITIDDGDADDPGNITVFEERLDRFARLNFTDSQGVSIGSIVVQLFPDRAGGPFSRFQALATTDFAGDADSDPFWTDVNVHRVIPGFIVQTGDAENGDGTGGSPLGQFDDQFALQGDLADGGALRFSGPGALAMANAGADTNDSQWFFTDRATPFLNFDSGNQSAHMVFGQMIAGQSVFKELITSRTLLNSNGTVADPPLLSDVELITDRRDTSFTFTADAAWDGQATAVITIDDGTNVTTKTVDLRRPGELGSDPTLTAGDDPFVDPTAAGATTVSANDDSGLGVDLDLRAVGQTNRFFDSLTFDPATGQLSPQGGDPGFNSFLADATVEGIEGGQLGLFDTQTSETFTVFASADGSPDAAGVAFGAGDAALATALNGDTLYVARQTGRIEIFDVADPANPALQGSITLPDTAWDIEVLGDTLLVANEGNGVVTVDATDPANPASVNTFSNGGAALDLAVSGDTLYIADPINGLVIADITDPTSVSAINTIANPSGVGGNAEVRGVQVEGDRLYAAQFVLTTDNPPDLANDGAVTIYDLAADPTSPAQLGVVNTAGNPWGIAVQSQTLFLPDVNGNIAAVDVSDPAAPATLDTLALPAGVQPYRALAVGDLLVLADFNSGDSFFFDIADPANLAMTDRFGTDSAVTTPPASGLAAVADGRLAVPAGEDRVALFDATAQTGQPEITVEAQASELVDGADTIDFGSVELGDPAVEIIFTVTNDGAATLNLSEPQLPAGYNLAEPLDLTLAPAASDTFTVQLPTDNAGTFNGDLALPSDDADENPFTVALTGEVTIPPGTTAVSDRLLFYDESFFDDPANGFSDADAIAADKSALLPGETGGFENISNFTKGLNGVFIDITNLASTALTAADFEFAFGNDDAPDDWDPVAADPAISVEEDVNGVANLDRVKLLWDEADAVKGQWLEVTVKANANTGLDNPDVFYFGNAVGDTGNSATDFRVNATDVSGVFSNLRGILDDVPIDFAFDVNRDERVNATDVSAIFSNLTGVFSALQPITPSVGGMSPLMSAEANEPSSPVDLLEPAEVTPYILHRPAPPDGGDPAAAEEPEEEALVDLLSPGAAL